MEPGNFENRKFHEILMLVTSEAIIFNEFSSLTRISLPCGARLAYYYMTRRAVLPKSNICTGLIGPVRAENRFGIFGVFNIEFLEIGEFVWPNSIFPIVFLLVAFDWRCQIAKQKRNAGAGYGQALVLWNRKIPKIENFMKY